jgi:N-carbamoyl-L-amino-acid hydrolase
MGSHLDSVPDGGAFDGALGVVSSFLAFDDLRARDALPDVPIGIVNFVEEEGGRFGITCLGSRVLTGEYDPETALALRDLDGVTLAETLEKLHVDAASFGADPVAAGRIGTYLELHVEQGKGLVDLGRPVAIGSSIRPYGAGVWRSTARPTTQGRPAWRTVMTRCSGWPGSSTPHGRPRRPTDASRPSASWRSRPTPPTRSPRT